MKNRSIRERDRHRKFRSDHLGMKENLYCFDNVGFLTVIENTRLYQARLC